MTVEAREFEREVADADLVAAVTLGCSSSTTAQESQRSLLHLKHGAMSARNPGNGLQNQEPCRRKHGKGLEREEGFECDIDRSYSVSRTVRNYDLLVDANARNRSRVRPFKRAGETTQERPKHFPAYSRTEGEYRFVSHHRGATFGGNTQSRSGKRRDVPKIRKKYQQPSFTSAAAARVEAVAVDTVRRSLLHRRPTSASPDSRNQPHIWGCGSSAYRETERHYNSPRDREESVRLRPQSARLPEPRDFGEGVGDFGVGVGGATRSREPGAAARRETWVQGKESDLKAMQPPRLAVSKRPASAGARVVDTRTWSSTVVQPNVFRSRPQRPRDPARSGRSARLSPPTHARQVAEFLSRKEREGREHAKRERAAAIKGRFEIIPVIAYRDEDGTPSRGDGAHLGEDRNVGVVGSVGSFFVSRGARTVGHCGSFVA